MPDNETVPSLPDFTIPKPKILHVQGARRASPTILEKLRFSTGCSSSQDERKTQL